MIFSAITLKIFWTISLILIAGLIGILLANGFSHILRVRADKQHSLKIINKGNTSTYFHLSASSGRPDLTFTFLQNNVPLVPVPEEIPEESMDEPVQTQKNIEEPVQISQAIPADQPVKDKEKKKPDTSGALKAGKSVAVKSGVVAGLLGTLGSVLPGSLGASLKEKSAMARGVQAKSAKATQAPQMAANKMDALKSSGGKLGMKTDQKEDPSKSQPTAAVAADFSPQKQVVIPVQDQKKVENKRFVSASNNGMVQSGAISPGEALLLTLRIGTNKKRYPVGSFNYEIKSQQVPLDSKLGDPAPFSKTGTVYYKPVAAWRYWVPFMGGFMVYILTFIGIVYGLNFLWG